MNTSHGEVDEFRRPIERLLRSPVARHAAGREVLRREVTFRHASRDYPLTDVHGRVISELLA